MTLPPTPSEEIWRYSRIGELDLDRFRPSRRRPARLHRARLRACWPSSQRPRWTAELSREQPDVCSPSSTRAVRDRVRQVACEVAPGRTVADADRRRPPQSPATAAPSSPASSSTPARTARSPSSSGSSPTTSPRSSSRCSRCRPHQAARVRYVAVNELGVRVWQIGHQLAVGDRDSTTLLATVALGGDYARVRTDARLVGQGRAATRSRVYFGDGTPDARLPHAAGPRGAEDDERPAVQGRGEDTPAASTPA